MLAVPFDKEETVALYEQLLVRLLQDLAPLQLSAASVAELDVLACFSERAEALNLVCPQLIEEPGVCIVAGRHLVVEQVLDGAFTANDLNLNQS